jgi:iron complex transport system permease protein
VAPLLWSIRFPRVLFGALVGATLAASGGALQGLFRNPLADPSVIGVSSGAALSTASFIVLGGRLLDGAVAATWVPWLMPVAAFIGASGAAVLVFAVSRQRSRGELSVATMLLAGIAVNALAGAGTGLLTSVANDTQLRALSFWSLGSLGGASWSVLAIASVPMLVSLVLLLRAARPLDLLLLGEREATHLGVATPRLRLQVIAGVALGVGSAVAFSGMIGFVGLIIPHLVRMAMGPSHRGVLPLSALLGAALLVLTDLGSRTVVAPAELPIGAVTAALGAPVFLWMVLRHRRGALG